MKEISPNIFTVGASLFLKEHSALVINDLHLGYEESLHHKGVLVPKFQLEDILKLMGDILEKTAAKKVIINGDLKHEFGKVLKQEWKEVWRFLDFLSAKGKEVVIIQGNHDPLLKLISEKKGVSIVKSLNLGDILIVHGDELVETKAKRLIIGHEHPAITLRQGSKKEKYKCFLKGLWNQKELIAVPSFNPLLEGSDILKEDLLSPFLKDIGDFEVFIVGKDRVLPFGKVKYLSK